MDKSLGKEYIIARERKAYLKDNCDCVVEKGYMKPFEPEKIVGLKEELAEISIEIGEIESEKKASAVYFNAELKPRKEKKSTILRGIKERAEYVKEECFKFVDQSEKMVGFYNSEGDLIESRPANPDELQGTIFQLGRPAKAATGTDN